jgi:hypothetical protein
MAPVTTGLVSTPRRSTDEFVDCDDAAGAANSYIVIT